MAISVVACGTVSIVKVTESDIVVVVVVDVVVEVLEGIFEGAFVNIDVVVVVVEVVVDDVVDDVEIVSIILVVVVVLDVLLDDKSVVDVVDVVVDVVLVVDVVVLVVVDDVVVAAGCSKDFNGQTPSTYFCDFGKFPKSVVLNISTPPSVFLFFIQLQSCGNIFKLVLALTSAWASASLK